MPQQREWREKFLIGAGDRRIKKLFKQKKVSIWKGEVVWRKSSPDLAAATPNNLPLSSLPKLSALASRNFIPIRKGIARYFRTNVPIKCSKN
jgi:hypothetical protein